MQLALNRSLLRWIVFLVGMQDVALSEPGRLENTRNKSRMIKTIHTNPFPPLRFKGIA